MTIAEQIKAAFAEIKLSLTGGQTASKTDNPEAKPPADGAAPGAITEEIRGFITAELKPVQADLTKAQADLTAANKTIADLTAQISAKDKEIAGLQAKEQDLEKRAAEKARQTTAGQGVPMQNLPEGAAASQTKDQQLAALQKQMAAETDPARRYELAEKTNALMFGSAEKK